MEKKNGGHGNGGRGGAAVNRFSEVKAPTQRPADVTKGASNQAPASKPAK